MITDSGKHDLKQYKIPRDLREYEPVWHSRKTAVELFELTGNPSLEQIARRPIVYIPTETEGRLRELAERYNALITCDAPLPVKELKGIFEQAIEEIDRFS